MNIHENTALLDAFADGELTAGELAEVQAHLAECPDCQAYVDDVLAIRAGFPSEDSLPLPDGFAERVMQAVAEAPQSRPKKQPWGKLAAAAACLAVIVLVQHGAGVFRGNTSEALAGDAAAAEEYTTEDSTAERSIGTAAACDVYEPEAASPADGQPDFYTIPGGADLAEAQKANEDNGGIPADEEESPTVRISAAELGDLLDGRIPAGQEDDGTVRYLLTQAELDALTEELAEQGVALEAENSGSGSYWLEVYRE